MNLHQTSYEPASLSKKILATLYLATIAPLVTASVHILGDRKPVAFLEQPLSCDFPQVRLVSSQIFVEVDGSTPLLYHLSCRWNVGFHNSNWLIWLKWHCHRPSVGESRQHWNLKPYHPGKRSIMIHIQIFKVKPSSSGKALGNATQILELQYVSFGSVEACHDEKGWPSFSTLGECWYTVCEFWLKLVEQVPTAMGVDY